jgi:hypothetical protein
MADLLRYYLDENVASPIADQLRRRGVDCVSALEVGRAGQGITDIDAPNPILGERVRLPLMFPAPLPRVGSFNAQMLQKC